MPLGWGMGDYLRIGALAPAPDGESYSNFIFIIFTFMDKTPSIHDSFIRSILSDKGIAIDYFKAGLPAFIRERLDFSTLEQLPDSYVSSELRKTVSDIGYAFQRKDRVYTG